MSMNVREQGCLFHFAKQEEDEGSTEVRALPPVEVSLSQLAALPNGREMTRCEVTKEGETELNMMPLIKH